MAQKTKDQLKQFFLTGSFPTQEQFADLIDSVQPTMSDPDGNINIETQTDGSAKVSLKYKTWIGTEEQYNGIVDKDENTIYYITD